MEEKIFFLNVFLRTPTFLFNDDQYNRASKIFPYIAKQETYGIVGLSEVFIGFEGYMLGEGEKYGYDGVYDNSGLIQSGGLMLLYKKNVWTIIEKYYIPFKICKGKDCFANKGFLVCLLRYKPNGGLYYFIVTHLNSDKGQNIQHRQFSIIKNYINKLNTHLPIILMGDFNFNIYDTISTTNSYNNKHNLQIIDYIIPMGIKNYSKTYVLDYEPGNILSDHNPIEKTIYLQ